MKLIITESQYKRLLNENDSGVYSNIQEYLSGEKSNTKEGKLIQMYWSGEKANIEIATMHDDVGAFKIFANLLPSKLSAQTVKKFKERYKDFIEETKTEVFISNADLQEFPRLLLNYPYIKTLSLYYNGIAELPQDIDKLKKLEELNMSANYLKNLPTSFANLDNLKDLDLYDNDFDVFPEEITKLKNLDKLDLSFNNIKEIPDSIANLANTLQSFRIGGNNFGGKDKEEALEKRLEQLLPNTLINLE
jgi:Leucine-rich repeat (LRR) protein